SISSASSICTRLSVTIGVADASKSEAKKGCNAESWSRSHEYITPATRENSRTSSYRLGGIVKLTSDRSIRNWSKTGWKSVTGRPQQLGGLKLRILGEYSELYFWKRVGY